jgi:hypothetical protein
MKHFKALVAALSVNLVGFSHAIPFRSSAGSSSAITQSREAPANDDAHQRELSLLSIVRTLQHRNPDVVAKDVKMESAEAEQSMHERQLLTDMGHLEDQLETWKSSESKMQSQMSSQAAEIARLKAEHLKAIQDEQEAAVVWKYIKMFMTLMTLLGLLLCVYVARNRSHSHTKLNLVPSTDSLCCIDVGHESSPPPIVEVPIPPPIVEVPIPPIQNCRSPPIVEVSIPPMQNSPKAELPIPAMQKPCEDTLHATVSLPHPTLAENPDIEAPIVPQQAEDVWNNDVTVVSRQGSAKLPEQKDIEPKCEFFSLVEDTPAVHTTVSAEDDWWN